MKMNRRELMQGIVTSAVASLDITTFSFGEAGSQVKIPTTRPCLYLNGPTSEHLRERFRSDKAWAENLRRDGETMLVDKFIPESVAEEGGGQQAKYGRPAHQVAFMGVTLGLLYHLTKEAKYAAQLHAALVYYGGYKRWGGPGLADRNPPWHSELDTSQFCFGYATGYDALYHYLSAGQRQEVREIVTRLGILPTLDDWISPGKRFHSLDSMGHNWWGVCVSGAGVAALALLGDDHRAQRWIDEIDDGFVEWFCYGGNTLHNRIETFEPDGPSYEGVHYTGYGVTSYLRYLLAWRTMFAGRVNATQKYLTGLPEFFLHTLYPTSSGSLPVNFDDTRENSSAADNILLLRACGIDNEYGRKYLLHASGLVEDPLPLYVASVPPRTDHSNIPLGKVYPKMGWALMRNSWDPMATLLAVKSGFTWNHAHADASTFLLMHKGKPLVIDSGTCNYGRPEYSSFYRQSVAHNVVLFDGKGQPTDQIGIGTKFRGSIINWFDGLELRYIGTDATGPVCYIAERNYRHFLWVGNLILIFDDIATHRDVTLDWLLHTAEVASQDGPRSILVKNSEASLLVTSVYPSEVKVEQRDGLEPGNPDKHRPYHSFSFRTQGGHQRAITLLDLNPEQRSQVETRSHDDYIEVTAQTAEGTQRIYFNLRSIDGSYSLSSTISIEDWTTDAYIVSFLQSGSEPASPALVSRFFVLDGSFLRHRGGSVFESLSKASCLWSSSPNAAVYTQSQRKSNLAIYCKDRPASVEWNGTKISSAYEVESHLLRLRSFHVDQPEDHGLDDGRSSDNS
jgi:hypothetical protein